MSFSFNSYIRPRRSLVGFVVLVSLLTTFTTACSKQEASQPEPEALTTPEPVAEETPKPEDPLKEARADAEGKAHGLIMPITEQAQMVTSEIEVMLVSTNDAAASRPTKIKEAPRGHFADEAKAKHVLTQNHGSLKGCYERALRRDPTLRGRVTLKLVIGTNGKVTKANVKGETLHDSTIKDCMELHARTMTFPEPQGGAVHLDVPFEFRPQF